MRAEPLAILPSPAVRYVSVQRGRKLQHVTIAWNSGECVIALIAGYLGQVALRLSASASTQLSRSPAALQLSGDSGTSKTRPPESGWNGEP